MALEFPFGIKTINPLPLNYWYGPYNSVSTANSAIPIGVRYLGLEVGIITSGVITEHMYMGGLADINLVPSSTNTVTDSVVNFGLKYFGDYSTNGLLNSRWLPDLGAVQNEDKKRLPVSGSIIQLSTIDNGAVWTGNDTSLNYNSILPKYSLVRFDSSNMSSVSVATTINIAGTGAKLLKDSFGFALKTTTLIQNKTYTLVYNFLRDWFEILELGGFYTNNLGTYISINGTDNYLADTKVNTAVLKVGDVIEYLFTINKTAAGIVAPIIRFRAGTTGTISDGNFSSVTGQAQTASVDDAQLIIKLKIESVGSSMSFKYEYAMLHRLQTSGFAANPNNFIAGVTGTMNQNTNPILGISINPGTAASWQFTNISIKINRQ